MPLCHSTVDNSVAPGIGRRLDGWPNRDLNVGAIIALAPDLSAVANLLQTDQQTVRAVLASWGPGRFDAQLFLDGKAFRPDGKTAATLLPAAFGLASVNLTLTRAGAASRTGMPSSPISRCTVRERSSIRGLNDPARFPVAASLAASTHRLLAQGRTCSTPRSASRGRSLQRWLQPEVERASKARAHRIPPVAVVGPHAGAAAAD